MIGWLAIPNLHPAVVHFPIALLPTAVLFDTAALILRRVRDRQQAGDWQSRAATLLYAAAAVSSFLALRSGESARSSFVDLRPEVQSHVASHSDAAHSTAFLLLGITVLHAALVQLLERRRIATIPRLTLLTLALVNCALLIRTADLGSRLVYRHGLGVAIVDAGEEAGIEESAADQRTASLGRLQRSGSGALEWRPLASDGRFFTDIVTLAPGFAGDAVWNESEATESGADKAGLPLQIRGEVLLLLGDELENVRLDVTLDVGDFAGTIALAHQVQGTTQRALFAVATDGGASLVDLRQDTWTLLDEARAEPFAAVVTLTLSSRGRQREGRIDGRSAVRGSAPAAGSGRSGLLFDGSGTLRIRSFSLRPE